MSHPPIRVAFFPDSYHEVNGVANTARRFESYARRRELPMLLVAGANATRRESDGSITRMEYARGPLSFHLEKDLLFDPAFLRHHRAIADTLREFKPDVVHVTGPSDIGIAGLTVAHELGLPLTASWHTNVHEYAGKRTSVFVPDVFEQITCAKVQDAVFALTSRFYKAARFLFAPNPELIAQLAAATGKPCFLMSRGVDSAAFAAAYRDRQEDGMVEIGYVGRLSPEKNVRELATIGRAMIEAGIGNFRIVIVGHGSESAWLEKNVPNAVLAGVRTGADLARAYANFDIFVFPSKTDTFGNVVLEALASRVPVVTAGSGGPKFIVEDGSTGFNAESSQQFCESVLRLARDPSLRSRMGAAARKAAERSSWSSVFDFVYSTYAAQLGFHA